MSAKTYVNFIEKAQSAGYKVNLIFLKLESAELARIRVGVRVNKRANTILSQR
jgi:predicted ABC-type ATPase